MTVNVSIQATLNNSANFFVVAWYSASASSVLINKFVPTKPYGNPWQAPLTGLIAGHTYVVKLWESPDDTATGTVRNSMSLTPTQSTTTVRFPDYLTVDITPDLTNNTTTYVNLTYAGWGYDVERVGQGTMYPVGSSNLEPDYDQDVAGGFHLVKEGDKFGMNEKFVVRFFPQVAPAVPSSTGVVTSGVILTAAATLDNTYVNQAIKLEGSGSTLPITLPPLSSIQDFQFLYIYSAGGNHVSAPITCGAGLDRIQRNTQVTQVILNQNDIFKLFKYNGIWQVDFLSPSVDMVGEIIYRPGYLPESNCLLLDGSLVSRTIYARLYAFFNAIGGSISETAWNALTTQDGQSYKLAAGGWTQGTDGTNFRLPLVAGQFIRGATAPGGGYNAMTGAPDRIRQHQHPIPVGTLPGEPYGTGPSIIHGNYNGIGNSITDMTSYVYKAVNAGEASVALDRTDVKTYPEHRNMYAIIRL